MVENCNAENLYKIVVSHLKDVAGMTDYEIATKLVCVGADGASVMQGHRTGLCVRLQTTVAPYMLPIHCMAHRMNLAYKMVSNHENVAKLEDLIRELHAYMSSSPKRFLEFQKFAIGITDGKKLLKDVETRWISLYEPACRVREEYPSLVGFMHKYHHEVDRARDLFRLTDLETLLTLVGILPMLKEINTLMKHAQGRLIYIVDFIRMRKMVCQSLDILYCSQDSFDAPVFENWKDLLDLKNPNTFLRFNIHDHLCITVNGREIPMHILQKRQDITGSEREDVPVTRNLFESVIVETRIKLKQISETLSSEIRERFCKDKILEEMGVMNPNFWNTEGGRADFVRKHFHKSMGTIMEQFTKTSELKGMEIKGILNTDLLKFQSTNFATTMRNQYKNLDQPSESGAIARLWRGIYQSSILQEDISEYLRLYELCQTMILGSVEDERVFSALSFIKSKLRNRLDKNLESCMRCYVSRYSIETFSFDRAIAHWNSLCERRGVNNTATSTNIPNLESVIGSSSHSTEDNIEFDKAIDNGLFQL
ncbi:hypothetical protein KI387_044244 [Taxus chinensis]|uniref:Uncharacterized protein n=2 Tax=Taxus chinensis TaxID=29808 RepID=A0AA38F8P0_TAXCH|nr:hypothetical protein KI387_044244 [Taxus chinensis]